MDGPRLSRIPVKIQKQDRQSTQSRSRSSCKPSLKKNLRRSKSALGELHRQRSGSLLRQNTPLVYNIPRSARKSPIVTSGRKDNRPVSDKRWQYEQLVKIKNFVAVNIPEIDHNNIKSGLSLDTFIVLVARLFELIDKRLMINRENYMEEIPANLKLFNYPVTIKPSLMKTVNTAHSWPSVVAIISWLTDLVSYANFVEDEPENLRTITEQCIMELFPLQINNKNVDDAIKVFDAKLVKYFNIDEQAIQEAKKEIEDVKATVYEYKEKNRKILEETEAVKKKLDLTRKKCEDYNKAQNDFETDINENHNRVASSIEIIDEEIEQLYSIEKELNTSIANQPHTLAEKQLLMSNIEDLQDAIKLKEERCQKQIETIHMIDHQMTDLRQNLQTEAYCYNNIISQLARGDSSLKELHIRESGFMKNDTKNELERVEKLLKTAIDKTKDDAKNAPLKFEKLKEEDKLAMEILINVNNELEQLKKAEAEFLARNEQEVEAANSVCLYGLEKKQSALEYLNFLRTQLMELKNKRPPIQAQKEEILLLHQKCIETANENNSLQCRAVEFFIALDSQINDSIKEYTKIMETITNDVISKQQKLCDAAKIRVALLQAAEVEFAALREASKKDQEC
ncbi:hypothetical protein FQR65_LT12994 [Abscondita terminalis]|nr:hypothetical protein FQR65_LT12994 [Abscondita terminalis]